jgi:hypothetical protein
MKTVTQQAREPYERGPHVRYFIEAVGAALFIVIALIFGIAMLMQLIMPD